MDGGFDLLGMIQGLFQSEVIEDYTCIKCSIKHHLNVNWDKIGSEALKNFLSKLVTDRNELDED